MTRRVACVRSVAVVGSVIAVVVGESVVVVTADAMRRTRSMRTMRSARMVRTPCTSRILKLRGGVSCFYYTDPNELRNPSSDFTTLGPFVPKSAIKVGNAVAP